MGPFKDIGVEKTGHVALVEIRRPPHNYYVAPIRELATAFEALDADLGCRALVLAAQGKAFCAGANFGDDDRGGSALLGGPTPALRILYRRQPAVPYQEADRRCRSRRRHRRRVELGDGGRSSGDVRRSAVFR